MLPSQSELDGDGDGAFDSMSESEDAMDWASVHRWLRSSAFVGGSVSIARVMGCEGFEALRCATHGNTTESDITGIVNVELLTHQFAASDRRVFDVCIR